MSTSSSACQEVTVFTFRGDRGAFGAAVDYALKHADKGVAADATGLDCLLYAGHTGVSVDVAATVSSGAVIYGFNPDGAGIPNWQLVRDLKRRTAFPGVVRDDTAVFQAANARGLPVLAFRVRMPDRAFQEFVQLLSTERSGSRFTYGFPDGDGECNCTTWLERLGLPLLTGVMEEFVMVKEVAASSSTVGSANAFEEANPPCSSAFCPSVSPKRNEAFRHGQAVPQYPQR